MPHQLIAFRRALTAAAALLAALVLCAAAPSRAGGPVCTAAALKALKKIPPAPFPCEDSNQLCATDKPLGADGAQCKSAAQTYEKTLANLLTPNWWTVPASALEACRVRRKPGALSKDEAALLAQGDGETVQGTDRVRMLVVGNVCNAAGMSNVFLLVRTGRTLALTPLYYDFNAGGQEAPFTLDVVNDKSATFALFTTQGHDMRTLYTTTTAYRIDRRTGAASPYPLFYGPRGGRTILPQSQPVISDEPLSANAIVHGDKFVKRFESYQDNLCSDDNDKCTPVSTEPYTWNGKAFVIDDYANRHADFMRKLAAQRDCVRKHFDPARGIAACPVESECENYNDLAWLNLKAGNFNIARNDAEMALDYCAGYPREYQAAVYNYRHSREKLKSP